MTIYKYENKCIFIYYSQDKMNYQQLLEKYSNDLKYIGEIYNIMAADLEQRLSNQPPTHNAIEIAKNEKDGLRIAAESIHETLYKLREFDLNRDQSKDISEYLSKIREGQTAKVVDTNTGTIRPSKVTHIEKGGAMIYVETAPARYLLGHRLMNPDVNVKPNLGFIWDGKLGVWKMSNMDWSDIHGAVNQWARTHPMRVLGEHPPRLDSPTYTITFT